MFKSSKWGALRTDWPVLSYYQRFEGLVAMALTLIVGVIILVALYRLVYAPGRLGEL